MKKMTKTELTEKLGDDYHAPAGLYERTKAMSFLGTVSCNISEMDAGSWQEIVLDYELGQSGMADGSWFKATFRFYSDWELFQTTDPTAANYVSAEYHAGPTVEGQSPASVQKLSVRFDQKGHERPFQKAIIVDTYDGYLKAGDHIVIRMGDRRFGGPGTRVQTFTEQDFKFRCYVDPLGTSRFAAVAPDIVVNIKPGTPAALQWAGPRIIRRDEFLPLRIRVEDQWGNTCWRRPDTVQIRACRDGVEVYQRELDMPQAGWSVALLEGLPTDVSGELVVRASMPDYPVVKDQVFYVTIDDSLDFPRIFYADLHVHSNDTIGTNSTEYNLAYGREVTGLDILAFAHNDFNITTERWKETVRLIREITEDGKFVAYPGTEWCGSSCAGGDHNVVFLHERDPEFPFLQDGTHVRSVDWNEESGTTEAIPGAWPLEELWAAYIDDPEGHLLIPHVGGRRCILDWHHPTLEKLIEIGSSWGHFGWLYQEAMERGYKIGASMAGDEHRGRCGGGVPGTAVFGTKGGISGVIAPELSREAIAIALRKRHTFASTGERIFGFTSCGAHIMGDEFEHSGAARVNYRFLGDEGWDRLVAYDHSGEIWSRNLQEELGYSDRKIRFRWGGARIKDRYRWAVWKGSITIRDATINEFVGRGFEHMEETCWRESATTIGFKSDTYGDIDALELDISNLQNARITIEGTIDGYVKVGDPLKGNPFVHCPTFKWELTGAELLNESSLKKNLPGVEMFLGMDRMSDLETQREVSGHFQVDPENGPHGHRPIYMVAHQGNDAKVWTSGMFITFK
jgi:hypothetical protein